MAYCTKCGALLHDEDMFDHVCDPDDVPDKGKPIRIGTTKLSAVEKA